MFQFFTRKKYLADYLGNFVDIHNHILPGIDDGAQDLEESMALIRGFGELGISQFVATPHILPPLYPNTPESIRGAHGLLMDHLMDHQLTHVAIEPAAEHMIDDSFEDRLEKGAFMPLRQKYLLVEMSYLQPPLNFEEAILQIAQKGLSPILAHPERYGFLHERYGQYRRYAEKGVLLQLNLLSLGSYYGHGVQKTAYRLLEDGLVDLVASDAHNVRHLEALKSISMRESQLRLIEPVIRNTIDTMF